MVLEDSYGQAHKEMVAKQTNLKVVRPSSAKMKMDMHHIKTMENQLDQALVKYSDFQAQNKKVRGEIDVMRKQMKKQSHSEETNNQILALKAKHEHDKLVFEMKIMEL